METILPTLDVNIKTAIWIIKAVTVLHNFIREKDSFNLENILHTKVNTQDFHNIPNIQTTRGGISANFIRTTFTDFVSEAGSVP